MATILLRIDIIAQIQAIDAALNKVAAQILDDHLHSCAIKAVRGSNVAERERGFTLSSPDGFKSISGQGIEATIDGQRVPVNGLGADVTRLQAEAKTPRKYCPATKRRW